MHTAIGENCPIAMRESSLADLGELAGPVLHEINNALYSLALRLAILQESSPGEFTPELLALRQQIMRAAEVTTRYQRYPRQKPIETALLDLNAAILHVIDELRSTATPGPIVVALAAELPRIRGLEADVRRLLRFLLANAVRAAASAGPNVVVRTAASQGGVLIQVEDGGPDVPVESLPHLFDPGPSPREGMCCLEMAACRSIVRRLRGKMQAAARPGGGLIVSVQIPAEA